MGFENNPFIGYGHQASGAPSLPGAGFWPVFIRKHAADFAHPVPLARSQAEHLKPPAVGHNWQIEGHEPVNAPHSGHALGPRPQI